jgi:hypothetical protein
MKKYDSKNENAHHAVLCYGLPEALLFVLPLMLPALWEL